MARPSPLPGTARAGGEPGRYAAASTSAARIRVQPGRYAAPWPFVVRGGQRDEAVEALEHGPGAVILSGPVGAGRTRLLEEVAATMAGRGHVVEWLPADGHAATALDAALQRHPKSVRIVLAVDGAHLLEPAALMVLQQAMGTGRLSAAMTVQRGCRIPETIVSLWKDGRARRIDLEPFSEDDTACLLRSVLGHDPDGSIVQRLWSHSGGNMLVMRRLLASGPLDGAEWEELLTAAEADRLDVLEPHERDGLELVALAEPLSIWAAARVVSPEVLEHLEDDDEIVAMRDGGTSVLRLARPARGPAIRRAVPAARARSLWQRLVTVAADRPDRPMSLSTVVRWRLEAGEPVDASSAHAAAIEALERPDPGSAELLAMAAISAGVPDAVLVLAEALAAQGRWWEISGRIAELDPAQLDGGCRARLLALEVWPRIRSGDVRGAAAVLDRVDGEEPDAAVADVVSALRATVTLCTGSARRGTELAMAVLSHPDLGNQATRTARWAAVVGEAFSGRAEVAKALADDGVEWAHAGAGGRAVPELVVPAVLAMAWCGRIDQAQVVADRFQHEVRSGREASRGATAAAALGLARSAAGDLGAAAAWLTLALAPQARTDPLQLRPVVAAELALVRAWSGDHEGARSACAAAERSAAGLGLFGAVLGRAGAWVAASSGDLEAARAGLHAAARQARHHGQAAVEARVLHDLVRTGAAAEVVDRLERIVARHPAAALARFAAHARAQCDGSPDALERAALTYGAAGASLLAAETWAAAAAAYRARGQERPGRRCATRAAELAALCGPAATPLLRSVSAPPRLTEREDQMVNLARQGLSSRQIAQRLDLSHRTVENHLHRAYAKLGVSNRQELVQVHASAGGAAGTGRGEDRPARDASEGRAES